MTLVLGIVALTSVVLSFTFAALALLVVSRTNATTNPRESSAPDASENQGGMTDTISRVLSEIAQLATLRDQGALTDKEFVTQKGRLLDHGDAPALPQRPR